MKNWLKSTLLQLPTNTRSYLSHRRCFSNKIFGQQCNTFNEFNQ